LAFTKTYGVVAVASDPATVAPFNVVVVVGLLSVTVAPTTNPDPLIVIARLAPPYVTAFGDAETIAGWGGATVNPPVRLPAKPPAAVGFVTVTAYAPGASPVLGHQNRSVLLLTNTYGTVAVATLPVTVVPVRPPTVTVAPDTKFVPEIVMD
jgi:hypothetical protein